jgi:hypothetical protein
VGTVRGMTSVGEAVLHALSVEPRDARAGDVVSVRFRVRNLGVQPSPAGRVVFALGQGLDALDAVEVDVEPVAPGEYVDATIRALVGAPGTERAEIVVRAALHLADAVLGTNACGVVVRSCAVLDGAASGTFVEAVDADTVRVRAVVVNEGDGPACGVRVIVPAPIGCVRVDMPPPIECVRLGGDDVPVLDIERLEPGARAELAFDARVVVPVGEIRADAGEVRFTHGRRVALPVRDVLRPHAVIAPPCVVVSPSRRRVDVAVDVANRGWVAARDVPVRIVLPDGLQLVDGSAVVDGVCADTLAAGRRRAVRVSAARGRVADGRAEPAVRLERDGAVHAIVIGMVAARSTVRFVFATSVPAACADGVVGVAVGEHRVDVPFTAHRLRDLRVHVVDSPLTAAPGDTVRIAVRVVNAGDVAENASVGVPDDGGAIPCPPLPPGSAATVGVMLHVPAGVGDDAVVERAVVVCDASGERARCGVSVVVRDRVWLSLAEPPSFDGGRVRYSVRNGGSTAARDVSVRFGDVTSGIDTIAAGETAVVEIEEGVAGGGGSLSVAGRSVLELPALERRTAPVVRAVLHAPERVVAGASFAVRLDLDVEDAVETLTVRVPEVPACAYVPGSALLDGRALLDRAASVPLGDGSAAGGRSPLAGDGLALCGVPGRTHVVLSWSLLADTIVCGDSVALSAAVVVDGEAHEVEPAVVTVCARDPFPVRPAGASYHAEACIVEPASFAGASYHAETCAGEPALLAGATDHAEACVFEPASFAGASYHAEAYVVEPAPAALRAVIASAQPCGLERFPEAGMINRVTPPLSGIDDASGGSAPAIVDRFEHTGPDAHDDHGSSAHARREFSGGGDVPQPSCPSRLAFGMRMDAARVDDCARLLHGTRAPGLVGHLFALRFFFPDAAEGCDAAVGDALGAVRDAVRDVFDRLFVKLRIPGFAVTADDLEDPALRAALAALFERLDGVAPDQVVFEESPAMIDRRAVQRALTACADASYGAPAVLRALVALLPSSCDDDPELAAAVRRHACLLDDVLSRYDGLPLELFDDALARRTDAALDDAREAVLTALQAHVLPAEVAC